MVSLTAVVTLAVVILAYIGLVVYQRAVIGETASIEEQITSVRTQIDTYDNFRKESDIVRRHVDDLALLLNQRIHWKRFFDMLETHTLPEVYYSSVTVDAGGTVSLNAIGSTTEAVSRQLTLLKRSPDFVTNVSISTLVPVLDSTTQRPAGYSFTLSLAVPATLFIQAN